MRKTALFLVAATAPFIVGCADRVYVDRPRPAPVTDVVYVAQPPPPVIVERRWAPPTPHHVWVPGHYVWNGGGYVWSPGYWVYPPRPHAHYRPAYWRHDQGGWILVEGHF